MRELSMHILDLAQNSIVASATLIEIDVTADSASDTFKIAIRDNGRGMSPEFLARVRDPFTTTRTTRRVGLGIPMFAEAAQACDGGLTVESQVGKGTSVEATFRLSHIDRAPLGDIAATLIALIAANPDIDIVYRQQVIIGHPELDSGSTSIRHPELDSGSTSVRHPELDSGSTCAAEFTLDTREIKSQLAGVPINENAVLKWLGEYIAEHAPRSL